jgi:hypothetical protein
MGPRKLIVVAATLGVALVPLPLSAESDPVAEDLRIEHLEQLVSDLADAEEFGRFVAREIFFAAADEFRQGRADWDGAVTVPVTFTVAELPSEGYPCIVTCLLLGEEEWGACHVDCGPPSIELTAEAPCAGEVETK